jgi:hypothetical protein
MATRKKASLAIELDDLGRPARPTVPDPRKIGLLDGTESSKDRTAPSLFLALGFRYSGRWY